MSRPGRYVRGEQHPQWRGDSAGVSALHEWLRANYPKAGRCENCGNSAITAYALIHGRSYSRSREDYRELCVQCHNAYDGIFHRGVHARSVRLNEDVVREIRVRRAAGETAASLAREYGVSPQAVSQVAHRRTWTWVV